MKKIFSMMALFILMLTVPLQAFSYDKYEDAPLDYFKDNRQRDYKFAVKKSQEIYKALKKQNYKYALEASAIIFPELIRYSQFQDEIESLINELLAYTTEESNGFSIGLLQMKPIFASQIEQIVSADSTLKEKYKSIAFDGDTSTGTARHDRILRLKKLESQLEYLKVFTEYEMERLDLEKEDRSTRIKFLATAYNLGIYCEKDYLEKNSNCHSFPSGKRNVYFSYQKICLQAVDLILKAN